MEIGNVGASTGGAVACPVCTLYLREGISLQRHLDTHPKEQVIEALIKASSLPAPTPPPTQPSVAAVAQNGLQQQQQQPQQQLNAATSLPAQSPYPVFECPPINTMMPPQFASFSYQQFVNNGTMMIPQYTMAPQANQMMQMLYNPYGMYQQQQIPTVQMISPIAAIPATRIRPVVSVANDTNSRGSMEHLGGQEAKQVGTDLISEGDDAERILPDIEPLPRTPTPVPATGTTTTIENEPPTSGCEEQREDGTGLEQREAQTQNSTSQPSTNATSERRDYNRVSTPQAVETSNAEEKVEDSMMIEESMRREEDTRRTNETREESKSLERLVEAQGFTEAYEDEIVIEKGIGSINDTENSHEEEEEEEEEEAGSKIERRETSLGTPSTKDEACESEIVETTRPNLQDSHVADTKETSQPEVEQLERLLITIMESNFETTMRLKSDENVTRTTMKNETDTGCGCEDNLRITEVTSEERQIEASTEWSDEKREGDQETCKNYEEGESSVYPKNNEMGQIDQCLGEFDNNFDLPYRYRCSLSAPSSPLVTKKLRRTSSLNCDYRSNENLIFCNVDFETIPASEEDHETKSMEDNFEEEDMEIEEEISSPCTPFIKQNDPLESSLPRSRTPLSAVSGISGLQEQTEQTVAAKEVANDDSARSFCPMDIASSSGEEEDEEEEEEEDEEEDDEEDEDEDEEEEENEEEANESVGGSSLTKNGHDRSPIIEDTKADLPEAPTSSNECKIDSGQPVYHHHHHHHHHHQSVITEHVSSFTTINSQQPLILHEGYSMASQKSIIHENIMNLSELADPTTSTESKSSHTATKTTLLNHAQSTELLNINENAHAGPMNVFEFDGLQILVPSTFISESSQKAISATSQQSMASSEGAAGIDEEVKSVNMRADETMPPRGELSEQESNGCTEHSAWQLYMGQESSRMSTSYDLMARESWEESEGSDNEVGVPLLDSRSLATHFTSSLFLDRDRKTPTKRTFKCSQCSEVFDCPKERRVHSTTVHKEAGPSGSNEPNDHHTETKDIKLLESRTNVFDDIFMSSIHMQQPLYHHQAQQQQQQQQQQYQQQQPLLHQLQPPQQQDSSKVEADEKSEALPQVLEISCAMCSQRFASERSLQLHNRRVHGTEVARRLQEISKCQICNEEFPSVMLFNAHLKIHPLECAQCGKYFYRKPNFKLHMKRHLGIKPFPCTVCDKAFLTKQKLDEHTNGHTGNAPVKCNLCNETFRRYSNLTQHKNRHHLNIKRKLKDYICHCGEVFHTKKKLAWHKETHDEKPKACTYCNERFIHMASLTRHMRRAHNRRFVPDAQRESENVECPICKCIYLRSSLSVHMRVHNGERPYECQVCSKAFSTKWNLQLHKWTHAARSTKPFKCNQCSAAFYRHSDYTAHMNSHRNVRPYTCNYCGAQFIRKYNCLRHVKEHEENKAYTCDICNKTFHRSYYLKDHLRVHSGARPYTCHICGKSSSTKSNHNKHVRIHHAREPVNTEN